MPYSGADDSSLPSYVKKLPKNKRSKWVSIFNEVYKKEGEKMAFIVANKWLKKNVKKKTATNRTSKVRERVFFEIDNSKEFISRTENGEEFVSFKLADIMKDKLGVQLNENILQKWAEQINSGQQIVGDIDHENYNKLLNSDLSDEEIARRLKEKPGIAKSLQAMVKDGALWVKALIDKRYKRLIQKAKGVSMEAILERDENDNLTNANLLGFTFGVKDDPVINGTEVNYHATA